ncbi:MAG: phosphoribosylformylglycinamidine synthase [Spirochaetes bacterium]|nr:phosphoribosylformylglycinamidine synthase [Spirochaetota bacterium]HOD13695.1 AIR synthase-related protein [Spirochaetota bacterium]HPG52050.1 AIR synthase-related protein [Spirochaetota bacterium]
MTSARYRIEVFHRFHDPRREVVRKKLSGLGFAVSAVHISDNYLVSADITGEQAEMVADLLVQPVIEDRLINKPYSPAGFTYAVEIGFLPGVTDNIAHTVRESIEDLLKMRLDIEKSVFSTTTYFFTGDLTPADMESICAELHNPLIQRKKVLSAAEFARQGGLGADLPVVSIAERPEADVVDLSVGEDELLLIGKEGIRDPDGARRGPLALDMLSMKTIRHYFVDMEKRNPTDIELESIAQTWSEHCKHTIFSAELDDDIPEGIFRKYIREATVRVRREKGARDFCVSVFEDNSGGIEFDENYIVSDKVETHNSPSALDPFGGAITGIVGVNRDAIGFGMAAKPIANRYGFCFADPFDRRPLYKSKDPSSKMLSPRRILEGVVHGVNAGGNTSGIPTPQGFLYFDERYKGKPLVFVGTVGLLPKTVNGKPSCSKKAMAGDAIVMIGGRVGRDGIHGATFSSEALSSGSPATAVQIGDPITQKKLSDAIVKEARDRGLYNSITDNGAGGLSCSVAEMARECGGFEVDLDSVPLKYPGLGPWQIWLSESQERMTVSVPGDKLGEFNGLMKRRGVESAVIGTFTAGTRGIVRYGGKVIFDIDMAFLHDGLPRKKLSSSYTRPERKDPDFPAPDDLSAAFEEMTGRLNTASFEFVSTQYDHEVQANSVIKPLQGKGTVNGNATVIRPLLDSYRGVVLSQGLYPSYGDIDAYWMAACTIDTAVRNAVAVGGSLESLAILDNFCWCDSNNPERLGQLREAARACYEFAVAYGTPFISGKDSMFNDFRGYDEEFRQAMISIPPTLLVSSFGVVGDIRLCQTIDFKAPGDLIYVIGGTSGETGGSEYLAYAGEKSTGKRWIGASVPRVDTGAFKKLYRALETALAKGLVASSTSVERGGLGLALAKSSMAGMMGFTARLSDVPAETGRDDFILYSESQGRVLVSVDPAKKDGFERLFAGLPLGRIGSVTGGDAIEITGRKGNPVVRTGVQRLMNVYKGLFKEF